MSARRTAWRRPSRSSWTWAVKDPSRRASSSKPGSMWHRSLRFPATQAVALQEAVEHLLAAAGDLVEVVLLDVLAAVCLEHGDQGGDTGDQLQEAPAQVDRPLQAVDLDLPADLADAAKDLGGTVNGDVG